MCPGASWAERGRHQGWVGLQEHGRNGSPIRKNARTKQASPQPSSPSRCSDVSGWWAPNEAMSPAQLSAQPRSQPSPAARRYLVLEDLIGHQLLQEVAMDGVAWLCPATRGGPLKRDEA